MTHQTFGFGGGNSIEFEDIDPKETKPAAVEVKKSEDCVTDGPSESSPKPKEKDVGEVKEDIPDGVEMEKGEKVDKLDAEGDKSKGRTNMARGRGIGREGEVCEEKKECEVDDNKYQGGKDLEKEISGMSGKRLDEGLQKGEEVTRSHIEDEKRGMREEKLRRPDERNQKENYQEKNGNRKAGNPKTETPLIKKSKDMKPEDSKPKEKGTKEKKPQDGDPKLETPEIQKPKDEKPKDEKPTDEPDKTNREDKNKNRDNLKEKLKDDKANDGEPPKTSMQNIGDTYSSLKARFNKSENGSNQERKKNNVDRELKDDYKSKNRKDKDGSKRNIRQKAKLDGDTLETNKTKFENKDKDKNGTNSKIKGEVKNGSVDKRNDEDKDNRQSESKGRTRDDRDEKKYDGESDAGDIDDPKKESRSQSLGKNKHSDKPKKDDDDNWVIEKESKATKGDEKLNDNTETKEEPGNILQYVGHWFSRDEKDTELGNEVLKSETEDSNSNKESQKFPEKEINGKRLDGEPPEPIIQIEEDNGKRIGRSNVRARIQALRVAEAAKPNYEKKDEKEADKKPKVQVGSVRDLPGYGVLAATRKQNEKLADLTLTPEERNEKDLDPNRIGGLTAEHRRRFEECLLKFEDATRNEIKHIKSKEKRIIQKVKGTSSEDKAAEEPEEQSYEKENEGGNEKKPKAKKWAPVKLVLPSTAMKPIMFTSEEWKVKENIVSASRKAVEPEGLKSSIKVGDLKTAFSSADGKKIGDPL